MNYAYSKKMTINHENNKGFIKINTTHKSTFSYYNYTDNIQVYKDIYYDESDISVNESNAISKSKLISNQNYFELCQNKALIDKTKYKRSIKPKISVIIPYYNKDKFSLYTPLRSIQNQSLKDIEIIIVDDGSSENKINEVFKEMEKDNRIIFLKHKINKGILISRIDGIRYASGEYILNIDQDDLYFDNHVFENIYYKAKKLNVDILQFSSIYFINKYRKNKSYNKLPKRVIITQPYLKIFFLKKKNRTRLGNMHTRMIWDKLIRRETYLEAIEDLGDNFLNHRFFLYEDTLMLFELSQIAHSYYYYNIIGYRYNLYEQGKSREPIINKNSILAMNQLYFIKLLLYKISPSYDRYHIFKEWGFEKCGSEVIYLDKSDMNLLLEVLEAIYELERIYKNTYKELLDCTFIIKKYFGIK
jgi:glycosyltransferase involved in cell wall biosynthesis